MTRFSLFVGVSLILLSGCAMVSKYVPPEGGAKAYVSAKIDSVRTGAIFIRDNNTPAYVEKSFMGFPVIAWDVPRPGEKLLFSGSRSFERGYQSEPAGYVQVPAGVPIFILYIQQHGQYKCLVARDIMLESNKKYTFIGNYDMKEGIIFPTLGVCRFGVFDEEVKKYIKLINGSVVSVDNPEEGMFRIGTH